MMNAGPSARIAWHARSNRGRSVSRRHGRPAGSWPKLGGSRISPSNRWPRRASRSANRTASSTIQRIGASASPLSSAFRRAQAIAGRPASRWTTRAPGQGGGERAPARVGEQVEDLGSVARPSAVHAIADPGPGRALLGEAADLAGGRQRGSRTGGQLPRSSTAPRRRPRSSTSGPVRGPRSRSVPRPRSRRPERGSGTHPRSVPGGRSATGRSARAGAARRYR